MASNDTRIESDLLGSVQIPAESLCGVHTLRARENFSLGGMSVHSSLIHAFGAVKLAAATTNRRLGFWKDRPQEADAIERSCNEMMEGAFDDILSLDALQGGAGTSLNMAVNEVLANRALQLCGDRLGNYSRISPLGDINRHQSTNDTFLTALKVAAIGEIHRLEEALVAFQESFQEAERRFAHVVKVGRTQLMDAVLTTMGRSMSAFAEAINRDRWRVYKCEERLRVVNLGGTAIGTGVGAPRQYLFQVVDALREITGIGVARAENLVDGTQNLDAFVEVSGILKACAVNIQKISNDLRWMGSGPEAGLSELRIPPLQAGSSIMPGKVNPVALEAAMQASMQVMGNDAVLANAAASGNLELNPFGPLVAHCLLQSMDLLRRSCDLLREKVVCGMEVRETRCREHVRSSTATITALLPALGYAKASEVAARAEENGKSIREVVLGEALLSEEEFENLITPEAVTRLGMPMHERYGVPRGE